MPLKLRPTLPPDLPAIRAVALELALANRCRACVDRDCLGDQLLQQAGAYTGFLTQQGMAPEDLHWALKQAQRFGSAMDVSCAPAAAAAHCHAATSILLWKLHGQPEYDGAQAPNQFDQVAP